tara:strand:- start:349 stop:2109 length:1761 start_codon:yes stop_codon:yes gene_type:complete
MKFNIQTFKIFFDIWKIVSKTRKIEILSIIILMILGSFSELVFITFTAPFIMALEEPSLINENKAFKIFFEIFNLQSNGQEILFLSFIFGILAFTVSLIRLLNLRASTFLAARIGTDLSIICFKKTLYGDYLKQAALDSSYFLNICTREISMTVNGLNLIFRLISGALSSFGILFALINYNYLSALIIGGIFTFFYYLLAFSSRNVLSSNSKIVLNQSRNQLKTVQDSLGLMKSIILENKYEYFIERYKNFDQKMRISQASNQYIRLYPRYFLEGVGLFVLALVSVIISNRSNENMLALAGTLALGIQRLLPSLQQIYSSWSGLKANNASIENIFFHINNFKNKNLLEKFSKNYQKKDIPFKSSILLSNIYFRYEKSQKYILKEINLEIKKGKKIGIKGKSGSGKSTLTDILLTIIEPEKGNIKVDGKTLNNKNFDYIQSWRKNVATVPQNIYLSNASIASNISLYFKKKEIDYEKLYLAAKMARIYDFILSLPNSFDTVVGERGIKLSGGQIQRIAIARAFYKGASVLIFDEPTSALDDITENEVVENIYNISDDITVIIIAHRLSILSACDEIYEIKNQSIHKC